MGASYYEAFVWETMGAHLVLNFEILLLMIHACSFITLLKILTQHLSFHHVLWFQLIVRVITTCMIFTHHFEFLPYFVILTHLVSFYHIYDFQLVILSVYHMLWF